MNHCDEHNAATIATTDIKQWEQQMRAAAAEHGFLDTWDKHVLELGQLVACKRLPTWRAVRLLLQMMQADEHINTHLQQAGRKQRQRIKRGLRRQIFNPNWYARKIKKLFCQLQSKFSNTHVTGVIEANGKPVEAHRRLRFRNWGGTVDHVPAYTFVPRSKQGVINIVRWAKKHDKRVRVAAYRHTWTSLYGASNEVTVSMLALDVAEQLPAMHPDIDPANDLQGINIVGTLNENGKIKALCKIGASTSNEQFRSWCIDAKGGNWQWTIPFNVIMVEITYGGSNAPICHGAGWKNETLSDLVTEIEFVNANGELQTVNDPHLLKAAAGCFGLLGIVTSITLKIDTMSYAVMQPKKKPIALCIPPVSRDDVPEEVNMDGISDVDLQQAQREFERQCEQGYYAEWFWFVFEEQGWINCWKNNGSREQAVDYPSPTETWFQEIQNYVGQLILDFDLFELLPGDIQARMLAKAAMAVLPSNRTIVTPLVDALHFRRGVQNMRVLDIELEIPIPAREDDETKPDWSVCQRAWWDAIRLVYESAKGSDDTPMRLTLEMRVMGGSSILMAPQYGNTLGTCSIEVLTHCNTPAAEWQAFKQKILDAWTSYRDTEGNLLNARPHWAKEWEGLTVHSEPVKNHLRDVAYVDVIPEFKKRLEQVAIAGNVDIQEMKQRFNNKLLSDILDWH